MKRISLLSTLLLLVGFTQAQILSVDPVFPHENDTITIIYHADQGNGDLTGVSPVYAHTGVITNLSSTPNDWRYVQGTWGTADPNVLMQQIGVDSHLIKYHVRNFYSVPGGETIQKLAFVFRDASGNTVGRDADGSDIFTPIYSASSGLQTTFVKPYGSNFIASSGDTIEVDAWASDSAALTLTDNGTTIATGNGENLVHDLVVTGSGNHEVIFIADNGTQISRDTFIYVVNGPINVANPPAGSELGINYIDSATVRLVLYAPNKSHVYVLGDFNNWQVNTNYYMNRGTDNATWWLDITGLTPGDDYTFQYYVDGLIKVADPYSELILDRNNDPWIPSATYPNIPAYPDGKTTGIVSVLQPGAPQYTWTNTSFTAPQKTDLVIYELHLRDFIARHDYETLLDTLDYLDRLGVNAIELMPVNEFEGNESWGYNPSFHMALDKYYGSKDDFKRLIDECHGRGIAVILDVVFNHAFSQSPLAQLYWDNSNFRPDPTNPWLNVTPRHDFNVGYDFNHESQATKDWLDRVMTYWLTEYKVDGFRFDLSKGFTQNNTLGNVGAWGAYDASRVAIWQRIYGVVTGVNPDAYVILEHFADNSEEIALSNNGMMLWGNMNYNYNEATMGYISNSNFSGVAHTSRGWSQPHLVGYMESHDEQRLMFKNLQFGNSNGGYDITELNTALARMELGATFFYTIPGPKMMWQFQELGYDIDIDDPCRVCNKPILWNYAAVPGRARLYKVHKALIDLRTQYPAFRTTNFNLNVGGTTKTIHLNDASMNVAVLGNFSVNTQNIDPNFQNTGWWYEYFTGDSIFVSNVNATFSFAPGEYRLYTTVKLPTPDLSVPTAVEEAVFESDALDMQLFPNPTSGSSTVRYNLPATAEVEIVVYNLHGAEVLRIQPGMQVAGEQSAKLSGLHSGVYLVQLIAGEATGVSRLVVQ